MGALAPPLSCARNSPPSRGCSPSNPYSSLPSGTGHCGGASIFRGDWWVVISSHCYLRKRNCPAFLQPWAVLFLHLLPIFWSFLCVGEGGAWWQVCGLNPKGADLFLSGHSSGMRTSSDRHFLSPQWGWEALLFSSGSLIIICEIQEVEFRLQWIYLVPLPMECMVGRNGASLSNLCSTSPRWYRGGTMNARERLPQLLPFLPIQEFRLRCWSQLISKEILAPDDDLSSCGILARCLSPKTPQFLFLCDSCTRTITLICSFLLHRIVILREYLSVSV